MSFDFRGKRCLITRAGRGIGRVLVRNLVASGAFVIAISDRLEDLESLEVECPGVEPVLVDVGDWDQTRQLLQRFLPIHLLVNNAAVPNAQNFLDVTRESLAQSFNINVFSLVNISQFVSKDLIARGQTGSIVNLSSIASKMSVQSAMSYCATKGAVNTITKCMARELGPHKIRVNAILPTMVTSEHTQQFWSDPSTRQPFLARHPLGSFATEQHIVDGILFLLSDMSAYITGVELPIDGGLLT